MYTKVCVHFVHFWKFYIICIFPQVIFWYFFELDADLNAFACFSTVGQVQGVYYYHYYICSVIITSIFFYVNHCRQHSEWPWFRDMLSSGGRTTV